MLSLIDPLRNRLLAELDRAQFHRLSPFLELISLCHGDVLYQANGKMPYVDFPVTATVSIDYLLEDGGTSEITRIGNEGMLGVSLFMGSERSAGLAVVQAAGYAYRLSSARLMEEFYYQGPLLRLLLRYAQARLLQVSQLAACNSHHTTKQRLCRYLLQMLDRSSCNEMVVTQKEIGAIIGVRREGVTDAARWLQQLGCHHLAPRACNNPQPHRPARPRMRMLRRGLPLDRAIAARARAGTGTGTGSHEKCLAHQRRTAAVPFQYRCAPSCAAARRRTRRRSGPVGTCICIGAHTFP